MDTNQHQALEIIQPVQNRDRSRRCRSKLLSALEYAESQQSFYASIEQSPERVIAGSISQRRDVADTLSPGKVVADTLSPGRVVADTLSTGRDVADTLSPRKVIADTLSPIKVIADTLSPGKVIADTLSPRKVIADTLSPGKVVADTLSPGREVTDTQSPGRDVADTLSPGKAVADTLSPGRVVTDTLSPGRDVADTLSPRKAVADTLSPGKAVADTLSPGRVVTDAQSPGRDVADTLSPRQDVAETLSPGRTVADTQTPGRTIADTQSPRGTVADALSPQRAVADALSPGGNVAVAQSPQRAVADLLPDLTDTLSPGRASSAHSIDKSDPKRNIFRSSSKSSSQVYDTPKPQRLDMTSGIGSALSSPEPSLFATAYRVGISPLPIRATPLPPIKSSQDKELKQQELDTDESKKMFDYLEIGGETTDEPETWEEKENKFQALRKMKEKERQKAVKEREDLGLQVVLPHQMKALALKLGKENGLKAGSLIRREDYLTSKTENMQKGYKKTDTSQAQNSVAESNANHMVDLPSHSKQKQQNALLQAPKVPHPPSRPKGNIIVRETKASRLRKNKLQMQSEKADETKRVLPPVKAPVKQTTRASIAETVAEVFHSPHHSRSSSESPPPTPIELEPSRPAFVPKLDLSGLLSPEDYPEAYPIPLAPRDIVVRETKASKLLRLKKLEDEKLAKRRAEEEKIKDMAFERPLGEKVLLGKRSPTQTFTPAPPRPYRKPEPVVIKETRASMLRKLREIKEEGNKGPPKKNKTLVRSQPSQQRLNMEKSATDIQKIDSSGNRNGLKRGETPMAHSPLQKGPDNTVKKGRVATPAIERQIRSNSDCPDEQLSRNISNQLPGELISQSEKKNLAASSKKVSGSVKNSISTSRSPPMNSKPISRNNSEKQAAIEVNKAKPLELKEHIEDKEREKTDESIRNKLCRIEMVRGLQTRKEVRLAMEEDEIRWQSELMEEFKDIEGPFVFGKPDDNNSEIIRQALDSLKEQLEEVEAADKKGSKSKVKSFISNKFGSYLKNKEKADKDEKEIENMKKVREETIDGYFTRTVHSLNSVLGDIWERFNYQQDNYREMLEKITLQEEMLNKWKSEAKHYRFMHTMLKKDYLGERKGSWYL